MSKLGFKHYNTHRNKKKKVLNLPYPFHPPLASGHWGSETNYVRPLIIMFKKNLGTNYRVYAVYLIIATEITTARG